MTVNVDVDRDFPRRVTWTSAVFATVLFMFLLQLGLAEWALGTAFGSAVGLYSFDVFRIGVRTFLRPKSRKTVDPITLWKKITVGVLFAIKLPIWLVTIYAAVTDPNIALFGFVAGLSLPSFVMMTKIASKQMVEGSSAGTSEDPSRELSFTQKIG